MSNDPTVLHLSSTAVLTEDTVNSDGVACSGLNLEITVPGDTGCIVGAVNGENIALSVFNVHIAVLGVVNLGDNTGYEVLALGVGVVILSCTGVDSVLNGGGSGEGENLCVLNLRSTIVLTCRTGKNYVVACNGLIAFVLTILLIAKPSTVDGENVAELVYDLHVAVVSTVHFLNNTCNEVVLLGVGVVILSRTNVNDFLDGGDNLGKLKGECLGIGCIAKSSGSGKVYRKSFLGNNNAELTINNGESAGGVVGCPSDSNVCVCSACCGKSDVTLVGAVRGLDADFLESVSNLISGSDNNFLKVLEAVNAQRNEIRIAIVQNQNTGYICSPVAVSCVSFIDESLVGGGVNRVLNGNAAKGGGEVTYVGTEVSGLVTQLEVQVLVGILLKSLTLDDNAIDGYCHTNIVLQGLACCEHGGYVESSNVLLGGVNDSCRTAVGLLHTILGRNGSSNLNGHTNLDAEISNRVLRQVIAVVTAIAVYVSQEEVVVLVVHGLGGHSNNNTLDNYVSAGLCSHVLCMRPQNVLGNGEIEGLGCGGTVCSLNGSSELVCKLFGRLFVYVYDVGVFILLGDGNLVGVNRPGNIVRNGGCGSIIKQSNLCSYFEVSCGNVLTLIEIEEVICSSIYIVSYCSLFLVILLEKITRGERGYTQSQCQKDY